MAQRREARERILDAALDIAETKGWEALRLADAARDAGAAPSDLPGWFREKDDLIDAWFERADRAVLAQSAKAQFSDLPARARLHRAIMTWLRTLAPHRRVTRQMVLTRLEPGHLHIQYRALTGISRTVQWLREAAGRDARYLRRALEESALTALFLTTFTFWLWDDSADAVRTSRLLDRLLGGCFCCSPAAQRARGARAAPRPGAAATDTVTDPPPRAP